MRQYMMRLVTAFSVGLTLTLLTSSALAQSASFGRLTDSNGDQRLSDKRTAQSSYHCSGDGTPTCEPGCSWSWNFGCLELFEYEDVLVGNLNNVPLSHAYLFDTIIKSPQVPCTSTSDTVLLDVIDLESNQVQQSETFYLTATNCCICFVASANGWDGFYLDSGDAGAKRLRLQVKDKPFTAVYKDIWATLPNTAKLKFLDFKSGNNPGDLKTGDTYKFEYRLENYGELPAQQPFIRVYLSDDSYVSTSDQIVYESDPWLFPWPGGKKYPNPISQKEFVLPNDLSIGTYHLRARVFWGSSSGTWSDEQLEVEIKCNESIDGVVELAVDSNNDGILEVFGQADQDIEENLPGLLLPVNNNDTDGDGQIDFMNTQIDSATDLEDIGLLLVTVPDDIVYHSQAQISAGSITLTQSSGNCRIFDHNDNWVLGPGNVDSQGKPIEDVKEEWTSTIYPLFANGQPKQFRIEAVRPGPCDVEATFSTLDEDDLCEEMVRITAFRSQSYYMTSNMDVITGDDNETMFAESIQLSADSAEALLITHIDLGEFNPRQSTGEVTIAQSSGTGSTLIYAPQSPALALSDELGAYAAPTIQTGVVAGDTFEMQVFVSKIGFDENQYDVAGVTHATPTIEIVNGKPASFLADVDVDSTFPATRISKKSIHISLAQDEHGNIVDDQQAGGVSSDGLGGVDDEQEDLTLTQGTGVVTIESGFAADEHAVEVSVGEYSYDIPVQSVPVDLSLTTSNGSIEVLSGTSVLVTASAIGQDGKSVPDGTLITWNTTIGCIGEPGLARSGKILETTISNGASAVELYPYACSFDGAKILGSDYTGTAIVRASVGFSEGATTIALVESAPGPGPQPLRVVADHLTLVGDQTANGVMAVSDADYLSKDDLLVLIGNHLDAQAALCEPCDLNDDGAINHVDLIQARNLPDSAPDSEYSHEVPYYAISNVEVRGEPLELVTIEIEDVDNLFMPIGVSSGETVVLDSAGTFAFSIQSKGIQPETLDFSRMLITARRAAMNSEGRVTASSDQDTGYLVLQAVHTNASVAGVDVGAILMGDSDTLFGIGFELIAGLAIGSVIDVRDVVVQTSRLWPGGEDVDKVTLGFALTSLGLWWAGPGKAVFQPIVDQIQKAIQVAKNYPRLTKVLFGILREITEKWNGTYESIEQIWKLWRDLVAQIIKLPGFAEVLNRLSEKNMRFVAKLLSDYDQSIAVTIRELAKDPDIGFQGVNNGIGMLRRITEGPDPQVQWVYFFELSLPNSSIGVKDVLKALTFSQSAPKKAISATDGLFYASGRIDSETMKRLTILCLTRISAESHNVMEKFVLDFADGSQFAASSKVLVNLGILSKTGVTNATTLAAELHDAIKKLDFPEEVYDSIFRISRLADLAQDPTTATLDIVRASSRTPDVFTLSNDVRATHVIDAIAETTTGQTVMYRMLHVADDATQATVDLHKQILDRASGMLTGLIEQGKTGTFRLLARTNEAQLAPELASEFNKLIAEAAERNITFEIELFTDII